MRARWQHHAPGARSLEGIDVVVHRVADGDGNRLLAVRHVQRDVVGRRELGGELVDEVSSEARDVAADRFLAGQTHALELADVGAGLAGAVGGGDDWQMNLCKDYRKLNRMKFSTKRSHPWL